MRKPEHSQALNMGHTLLSGVEAAGDEADNLVQVQEDSEYEVEPAYVSATLEEKTGRTYSMSVTKRIERSSIALATVRGPSAATQGTGVERRGMMVGSNGQNFRQ